MDILLKQAIDSIATNHISGAAEIAEQGADVFLHFARTHIQFSMDTFQRELLKVGWALIRAQPTMAPLVNLVNTVLWEVDNAQDLPSLQQITIETARTFKHQLRVREAAVAESVLPLIPERANVLTISRSSTVQGALRYAQHAGRRFNVICAEGRPGYEGRKMATELSEHRIPVTLVIDVLAIAMMIDVHLILVGADHLRGNDLVNKVGTYGLALAAKDNGIPMYSLCDSSKFLPPGYVPPRQALWPTEQVWDDPPSIIKIHNVYFDHTPLTHITGVVTEQGVLTTTGIEAWLASMKLHPGLKQQ